MIRFIFIIMASLFFLTSCVEGDKYPEILSLYENDDVEIAVEELNPNSYCGSIFQTPYGYCGRCNTSSQKGRGREWFVFDKKLEEIKRIPWNKSNSYAINGNGVIYEQINQSEAVVDTMYQYVYPDFEKKAAIVDSGIRVRQLNTAIDIETQEAFQLSFFDKAHTGYYMGGGGNHLVPGIKASYYYYYKIEVGGDTIRFKMSDSSPIEIPTDEKEKIIFSIGTFYRISLKQ